MQLGLCQSKGIPSAPSKTDMKERMVVALMFPSNLMSSEARTSKASKSAWGLVQEPFRICSRGCVFFGECTSLVLHLSPAFLAAKQNHLDETNWKVPSCTSSEVDPSHFLGAMFRTSTQARKRVVMFELVLDDNHEDLNQVRMSILEFSIQGVSTRAFVEGVVIFILLRSPI